MICIIVDGARHQLVSCVGTVIAHSPTDTPILICDYTTSDAAVLESLTKFETERLLYLRVDAGGPDETLDLAAAADLLLIRSDCIVASGWFDGLRAAAYADSRVATATAIADDQVTELEPAAEAVRAASLRLRPRIAAAGGECIYVRRSALELIGPTPACTARGLLSDGDFSARCVRNGLSHVLADDVLIRAPRTARSTGEDPTGPLGRALGHARRARGAMSVIVDAGILSGPITGTQVNVLETIAALARMDAVRLRALVPPNLSADVARRLRSAPGVELLTHDEARRLEGDRADLVHRPYQINNPGELPLLAELGDRLMITHQDLIRYFNPSYFASPAAWESYRQLTRGVLAIADRVVFVSRHARDEALAEELVEPDRATVVHIGVDHHALPGDLRPSRPAAAAQLADDAEVMLCIGADYRHKNRLFALRVLEQMRRRHDWTGLLVFAGPHVSEGSSAGAETELVRRDPGLAAAVVDCAAVTESEKAWLYRRARLVIYPTVHEGFGLVPFEAAADDVPCIWAPGTSLSELLPDAAAAIVPWDAELTAQRAIELLRDAAVARGNVESIQEAGRDLTWDAAAARLVEAYAGTCDAPATPASASERRHGRIDAALSEDSMRLIGPGGALPPDVERPLLALATHPRIAAPLFGALRFGYRTGYKLRRLKSNRSDGDDAHSRR